MAEPRSALVELTLARYREFYREPEAVFWAFVFPLVLVLVLGFAFRDPEPAKPRVAAATGAPAWLLDPLRGADDLELEVLPAADAARALRTGRVDLVVELDPEDATRVCYRLDPLRETGRLARALADGALQRAAGRTDPLATAAVASRERGGRYVDFLFPGILALNLMGSSMWGIGFSVVLARKRRMLKRLAATPMSRASFVASYFLSRLGFLAAEVLVLLLFARFVFDVRAEGSYLALGALALLGAASFAAISLVIAARVESIEAAYGWMNVVMIPMWLLSGTFFSYERFPELSQPLLRALPLTALNDALRAVMNDGAPVLATWPQVLVLVVWTVTGFLVARWWFRWQ